MGILRVKKGTPAPTKFEPYENCPFCKHREVPGCFGCAERKRRDEQEARKREEDLARMETSRIGTFRLDNPAEMATLASAFSAEALTQHFDSTDISDDDVLAWIGRDAKNPTEFGEAQLTSAIQFAINQQSKSFAFGDPQDWDAPKDTDEWRRLVLNKQKTEMAQERGMHRVIEAVRGKPGSGPAARENGVEEKQSSEVQL